MLDNKIVIRFAKNLRYRSCDIHTYEGAISDSKMHSKSIFWLRIKWRKKIEFPT